MAGLVQRLGELSLTTSAVLLPLLLLSGWMERRYRAESRVLLWLLISLWLLLPVRWAPPERAVLTLPVPELAQAVQPSWTGPQEPAPAPEAPVPESAWTWGEVLPWLWMAGCGGMLLWQAAGTCLLRRKLLRETEERPEDQVLLARLWRGMHGRPQVLRTEAEGPPLSMGLFRPVVLLPADLEGEETELVLRHELAHIRRRDLWYKALLNLVNAVHWFNSLVWWMVRRAGRDLELCCDNDVVSGQDAAFRHRYGGVLLERAARAPAGPRWAVPLSGGAREMKTDHESFYRKKDGRPADWLVSVRRGAPGRPGDLRPGPGPDGCSDGPDRGPDGSGGPGRPGRERDSNRQGNKLYNSDGF